MSDRKTLTVTNPFTEEQVASYDAHTPAQVQEKIALADEAFHDWAKVPVEERARLVGRMSAILADRKEEFARLAVEEMGKPLSQAISEVEKCAKACDYCAEHGPSQLADEVIDSDASKSYVRYLPLGIVLAIMPWNFPFWQAMRFMAPNLVAGNVGLLKHASNVPGCALALEEITRAAGLPEGVFQTLLVGSDAIEDILRDPRVKAATLTGSNKAGEAVAKTAGSLVKKTVLELGGSDPFIVMPSADFDKAVETAVTARLINNAQSCIAAKRFIVHHEIYDRFVEAMKQKLAEVTIGDPMDKNIKLGPLASQDAVEGLQAQVEKSVQMGAILWQADMPEFDRGFFFPPSILENIPEGSPAHEEELFGPVALLFRAKDKDDALRIANASQYGLGSAVFTNDRQEQAFFIDGLAAGMTFINSLVASDPPLPFGGVKASGYGRELSFLGMREFVNAKTVSIA